MAYTLEQYEALKEGIALGATTIQYSDRTVTYRSVSDMLRIKSLMERELFPSSANSANSRILMTYDKGL